MDADQEYRIKEGKLRDTLRNFRDFCRETAVQVLAIMRKELQKEVSDAKRESAIALMESSQDLESRLVPKHAFKALEESVNTTGALAHALEAQLKIAKDRLKKLSQVKEVPILQPAVSAVPATATVEQQAKDAVGPGGDSSPTAAPGTSASGGAGGAGGGGGSGRASPSPNVDMSNFMTHAEAKQDFASVTDIQGIDSRLQELRQEIASARREIIDTDRTIRSHIYGEMGDVNARHDGLANDLLDLGEKLTFESARFQPLEAESKRLGDEVVSALGEIHRVDCFK
ncbi:unnamed protein product, partial [Polarella glacialis]